MSNYLYSNIINYVFDTLKAQCGGAGTLSYVNATSGIMLGDNHEVEMMNRLPCIVVHLGMTPTANESWAAVGKQRFLELNPTIDIAMRPVNPTYPYGHQATSERGIMEFAADVLNVIENATNGLTLNGNSISYDATVEGYEVAADETDQQNRPIYRARIQIKAMTRFLAGGR